MKIMIILALIMSVLLSMSNSSYAQTGEDVERLLVLREGKQSRKNTVTVEVYLVGDILEVIVGARMYAVKPKISDVMLVGPKLGRLHYKAKEPILASTEEEDPYQITKTDGIIALRKRTKTKAPRGTLTRELFKLKIPRDKILPDKRYQLWIELESNIGRPLKFKFNLEELAELLSQTQASNS